MLFLREVRELLCSQLKCTILAEISNIEEFNSINCLAHADIMLVKLDVRVLDPYHVVQQATWYNSHLRVLAIKGQRKDITLRDLIERGFKGLVEDLSEIFPGIQSLMNGKYFFPRINNTNV